MFCIGNRVRESRGGGGGGFGAGGFQLRSWLLL